MRHWLIPLFIILAFATHRCYAGTQHLLPRVKVYEELEGAGFALHRPVTVIDPSRCALLAEMTQTHPSATEGGAIVVELVDSIAGAFNHRLYGFPDEAYSMTIGRDSIRIAALTPTGVTCAAQTLAQLALECDSLAPARIVDWPAFKLRGFMHDVGRSFISPDALKAQLRLLSQFKVNTFHWHLTENQAWRFEVKAYPQLTSAESMKRFPGMFYSQDDCCEIVAEAAKYGIIVIPEIDMPGHSDAFTRALGFDMQSPEGKDALLRILEEVVEVFADSPYIHIGADEKAITDPDFLDTMIDKLHSLGKKVVCWNPIHGVDPSDHAFDMTQMWSTAGKKVDGVPNIDCRYNYINHFDVFADLPGIYLSNIYYEQTGTDEVAGTITAIWNDRKMPCQDDIIRQNNFYANVLASAERAWTGGGNSYIEQHGANLPVDGPEFEEFADWERRFLLHKNLTLKDVPIPYVRQTNVKWHVWDGQSCTPAAGAGVYLRHPWGKNVPGLFVDPPMGQTAYAYTYIYSPKEQELGALIEFHNYSRSEKDAPPYPGQWDRRGSRIWLNGAELPAPEWLNSGKTVSNEDYLLNENFTARPPLRVKLNKGWNEVIVMLPHRHADGVRLDKWMWTFVLTDISGRDAASGLIYSPRKELTPTN